MDYRYYRGEGPELPDKWKRYLHMLRYVGTGMMLAGVVLPFLMVIHLLESTLFMNFLSGGFITLGALLTIVGVAWNSFIDRAE